ncbi:NAD(P)/FAD-dependent oxidoreductase [Rhodanobacter sp. C01]|uniref:NAD(P)/FAD-dependent oxidoreductase n=1 Tax=Rhodanobacter sp. C01 TaxID=1945856 RepID=UPI00098430E8|nr:NAD(P)/FAD-dependent oxidoreductase [Rhodanobacter sp. C01]OOG46787.1 FAD-dependent oxidoreductase [Rhodanobacter sp. C01]
MSTTQAIPHVVILGGGFGGLWATRALSTTPVRITLVDRTNHHLFQPLLYQVATAGLSGPDIAAPLRHILRKQRNVTVRMDEARSIDVQQRQVTLAGGTLDYDYLLVATGSSHAYFGHAEWERHAPGMKTMDDALAIRRHILDAFESAEREPDPARRAAWLSFVVIGAGPTGVELAGTLAEIAHHTLPSEFRVADPRAAQIHLVEAGTRVLSSMPPALSAKAQRQLECMGVHVHLNAAVTAVGDTGVQMGDQHIEARTLLWAAGVAASSLGAQLGAPRDRAGRVLVSPDLSLPQHPDVFVIGDLAHVEQGSKPVPGLAPAAKQMGTYAARAIRNRLAGRTTSAFHYSDYGTLASIGRGAAVVDLRGIHLSGVIAWWFWLMTHILFLIGFRNRLVVMLDWARSYCTWQRSARIIVGGQRDESE